MMERNKFPAVYVYLPMLEHPFASEILSHAATAISQPPSDLLSPHSLRALMSNTWMGSCFSWSHLLGLFQEGAGHTWHKEHHKPTEIPWGRLSFISHIFRSKPMKEAKESSSEHRNPSTHPAENGSSASLGLNSGHRLLYYNCSPATRARAGSWIEDAAHRTKHILASLSPSIP